MVIKWRVVINFIEDPGSSREIIAPGKKNELDWTSSREVLGVGYLFAILDLARCNIFIADLNSARQVKFLIPNKHK